MEKKICKGCQELKSLNEFYKNRTYHDGRMSLCSPCFTLKYAQKKNYIIVVNRENDAVRNAQLMSLTNGQVIDIVKGAILEERRIKEAEQYNVTPIITWDRLLQTKLVTPTKF